MGTSATKFIFSLFYTMVTFGSMYQFWIAQIHTFFPASFTQSLPLTALKWDCRVLK
jgi:hypothetical protein